MIQVVVDALEYSIGADKVYVLTPGKNGVVEPTVPHHVKPLGEVLFFVEFNK